MTPPSNPSPLFSQRHFEKIADILSQLPPKVTRQHNIAIHFANLLPTTNPNFNRDKFLQACDRKPSPNANP
jgi:hypothetical protein